MIFNLKYFHFKNDDGSQTDRTFKFNDSLPKPNWNPNVNVSNESLNRLLNPEVPDVHLKRYQWDQELKRRSVLDHFSMVFFF